MIIGQKGFLMHTQKIHMLDNLGPIQPPSRIRMSISISFLVKVKSYKV
jgi:hypothetical protein